jgi:hypothetical protein
VHLLAQFHRHSLSLQGECGIKSRIETMSF